MGKGRQKAKHQMIRKKRDIRHQRNSDTVNDQRQRSNDSRHSSAQASEESQEACEESHSLEEERNQEEHPAETPHVPKVAAGRVSAILAGKTSGGIIRVAVPGITEGQSRTGGTTVEVVEAAHLEVGPLRDVAGAADAAGVGAEEVGLS